MAVREVEGDPDGVLDGVLYGELDGGGRVEGDLDGCRELDGELERGFSLSTWTMTTPANH
jgi:hypothetical protein